MRQLWHDFWQASIKWSERNLFRIAAVAIVCGVSGAILMVACGGEDIKANADFVEPIIRGIKVLWGIDGYVWRWAKLGGDWRAKCGYILYEFGRAAGFIVFVRGTLMLLDESFVTLSEQRRVKYDLKSGKDVIAIHGDSELAAALVRNLQLDGKSVAFSDNKLVRHLNGIYTGKAQDLDLTLAAPKQVVVYESDYAVIEFLEKNLSRMQPQANVYAYLDEISAEGMANTRISPFSMAEICAELYWGEHPLYPEVAQEDFASSLEAVKPDTPRFRVVLIGSGDYAERILEQGLLSNIFDVAGGVCYDVIGDMGGWQLRHPLIDQAMGVNSDELNFHEGLWYEHRKILLEADRIILCGRSGDNVRIASELQTEPIKELHIRVDFGGSLEAYEDYRCREMGPEKVEVFGTLQELCTASLVLQDRTHEHGRLHHVIYVLGTAACNGCKKFDFSGIAEVPSEWDQMSDSGRAEIRDQRIKAIGAQSQGRDGLAQCLGCPCFQEGWCKMYSLLRRSNYALASHDGQKFRLLRMLGIHVTGDMGLGTETEAFQGLPENVREILQKIEHIRWCRLYYLNGWEYGAEKDPRHRTHPLLVPYERLSASDQSKDADPYLSLGLMIRTDKIHSQADWERIWLG